MRLADVPGAAWVYMQPAEHLLFCKQFSKMCLQLLEFQGPMPKEVRVPGSKLHQNLPWTGGDVRAKLFKIHAGIWISISPAHTSRQTSVHPFLYI